MKLNELPEVAQNAACELLKIGITQFIGKTSDNEPALELARNINAAFTELYYPKESCSFQSDNGQKEA